MRSGSQILQSCWFRIPRAILSLVSVQVFLALEGQRKGWNNNKKQRFDLFCFGVPWTKETDPCSLVPLLSFISMLIILLSWQVLCKQPVLTHLVTKGSYPCCPKIRKSLFQSGFLWCRKWVIFRSALNFRRARTDPCSSSHIILGSGKVAALGHLRAPVSSDGLSCQWVTFTRAGFQAVTNHSLSLQDSHPQWHNCVQVVCRGLASDISKLVLSFKCLREPVGVLQAHCFVYSFGLRFYV